MSFSNIDDRRYFVYSLYIGVSAESNYTQLSSRQIIKKLASSYGLKLSHQGVLDDIRKYCADNAIDYQDVVQGRKTFRGDKILCFN